MENEPWKISLPRPLPRFVAYTQLLKNKFMEKIFSPSESPTRINEELPFRERYMYYFWTSDPSKICDHLFVGSAKNAADLESLERNNIGLIVNATEEIDNFYEGTSSFEYIRVPLKDDKNTVIADHLEDFEASVDKIHEAIQKGTDVLVHCFMGASRSVAITCRYLIKYKNMSSEDAYNFVKERRICAAINENFMSYLTES